MNYPNAAKGVRKLFTSEILGLIGAVCLSISVVAGIFMLAASEGSSDAAAAAGVASLGTFAIFGTAGSVLAIIAFIFQIIGVSNASKDEPSFKTALTFILVGIVAGVLVSAFSNIGGIPAVVSRIASTVRNVADLLVTIFVIQGIINIANNVGNVAVKNKGNLIFKLIICVYVLSLVASIVSIIFSSSATGTAIAGVLAIIAAVLEVVKYIIFLTYLSNAKNMLNQPAA